MLALSGSHIRQSLLQRTCWLDKVSKERGWEGRDEGEVGGGWRGGGAGKERRGRG